MSPSQRPVLIVPFKTKTHTKEHTLLTPLPNFISCHSTDNLLIYHIIHLFVLFIICLSQLKGKLHEQNLSLPTDGLLWPSSSHRVRNKSTGTWICPLGDYDSLLDPVPRTWHPRIPCLNCLGTGPALASSFRKGWLFMTRVTGSGMYTFLGGVCLTVWNRTSIKRTAGVDQGFPFMFFHPSPTNIGGQLAHQGRGFCLFCLLIYLQCLGQSPVSSRHLIHVCWVH